MKMANITTLSLFLLITIVFTGCTVTSTTTQPALPQLKASSINLQVGGKTSFSLGKNEIKSVVIFLENNEYAYINYVITPTEFNRIVDVTCIDPSGSRHHYASYPDWNLRIGELQKGYYSLNFTYVIPPLEDIEPDSRDLYTMAPDTFEVYVLGEVTTEYKTE